MVLRLMVFVACYWCKILPTNGHWLDFYYPHDNHIHHYWRHLVSFPIPEFEDQTQKSFPKYNFEYFANCHKPHISDVGYYFYHPHVQTDDRPYYSPHFAHIPHKHQQYDHDHVDHQLPHNFERYKVKYNHNNQPLYKANIKKNHIYPHLQYGQVYDKVDVIQNTRIRDKQFSGIDADTTTRIQKPQHELQPVYQYNSKQQNLPCSPKTFNCFYKPERYHSQIQTPFRVKTHFDRNNFAQSSSETNNVGVIFNNRHLETSTNTIEQNNVAVFQTKPVTSVALLPSRKGNPPVQEEHSSATMIFNNWHATTQTVTQAASTTDGVEDHTSSTTNNVPDVLPILPQENNSTDQQRVTDTNKCETDSKTGQNCLEVKAKADESTTEPPSADLEVSALHQEPVASSTSDIIQKLPSTVPPVFWRFETEN